MINVRIEQKPAFSIAGRKVWISGQDNEQFGAFWREARDSGLIGALRSLSVNGPGAVTHGDVFGVSCVERDPNDRAFYFFIAAEYDGGCMPDGLECHAVPAAQWAVFSNTGDMPKALIDAEMFAFMEWLPSSGYTHALAPELEVYPAHDASLVEFWLPIAQDASL